MASAGNPVPESSTPSGTHPAPAGTERPPAASLKDWRDTDQLLQKWQRRARESQYAHYEAAKALTSANYWLGIPVTIFSTLVGTTVYATLQKQVDVRIQILIGSISVLTAILAGVQTFLRYGERAEKHRAIAASYGEARRTIESTAALPVQFRPPLNEFISQIERRLDDLSRSAPNVSDRIFARGLHHMTVTAERHGREAVSGRAPVGQEAQAAPLDPYI